MKAKFLSSLFLFSVLFISCSSDDDSPADGNGGEESQDSISTFTSVDFSFDNSARFFATSTGKMYSESEINDETAKIIDVVGDSDQAFIAFVSPSVEGGTIPSGTVTKFQYQDVTLTAEDFEAMTDDSKLKNLTVTNQNESLPTSSKGIILFENAAGKKGAIKINAINASRLQVDIKVMK